MVVIAGIALFVIVWGVSAIVIGGWIRHPQRRSLLERLKPYNRVSVADEAQTWREYQQS
ncbi:MAG TPA: hypothetical protein VLX59_19970 [Acidimicrobiales bacterium]|nr:hypothetical protein [Acidimicrobiales bacterium]